MFDSFYSKPTYTSLFLCLCCLLRTSVRLNAWYITNKAKCFSLLMICPFLLSQIWTIFIDDILLCVLKTWYSCIRYTLNVACIVCCFLPQALRIEHCERVHIISVAKRICIANCRECVFFLGVNQQPLIVGDNHKLQVSPFS